MKGNTFGEHLRREREMRGVSLEEISAATRIGTRFLHALENDQWDRLPGGVFNRGFIRAMARYLGLDEETLVAEYALATNEKLPAPAWPQHVPRGRPKKHRGTWLAALMVVVLAFCGWFVWHRFASDGLTPRPASASARAESPQNAPETAALAGAETATLLLRVAAARPTFVSVVADGKSVFDREMIAGENQSFLAQEGFEVSSRDSSAVLLELNGQAIPPIGAAGHAGKATFTRQDLRSLNGGPN